jgi:uncharacterized protein (DUF302 family)
MQLQSPFTHVGMKVAGVISQHQPLRVDLKLNLRDTSIRM